MPADLQSADAIFLGNSVRGLVPAQRIDAPA
jgi:branched-subunit amino acid aminotransferase/4-amino-4-deoxychorismate lyase